MHFIFMLTRHDTTIVDGPAVLEEIAPLHLGHIGFKDVGVDFATLRELTERIHQLGARSYLEIVSATREARLASVQTALQLGVDCLLGGTEVAETLAELAGSGIEYFPYPGEPYGHPVRLRADADGITRDCARFMAHGCAGANLLAYRAGEAEPTALIQAARQALGADGRLIVAGGIASPQMIQAICHAGADAFTIGSAIFDGSFSPRKGLLRSRLADVLAACQ
ncbi:MAG TPA: hypothetical protein VK110_06945 [Salinisphaeraceae bacterium]|nr:hypothetical protein [Salinisphaeraceae bacterium]